MKIFITGGTGFVGRHTVAELARRGHRLLLLTRQKNLKGPFPSARRISFVRGSITDAAVWSDRVRHFKPDVVLHMAWEGIPDYGPKTSIQNLIGGLKTLRLAAALHPRKIVCVGSDKEYGIPYGKLEESVGLHPGTAFSAAKTALHWIGREVAKENGTQFIWARIFFAYGPGQRAAALIPYLLRCKEKGDSPEIRNMDGANDFVYIGDVARALAMLVEKRMHEPYALYNIASGRLVGVREIVNLVYGRRTTPRPLKRKAGAYADISRINKEIGWAPKVDIKKGIQKTAAYYNKKKI